MKEHRNPKKRPSSSIWREVMSGRYLAGQWLRHNILYAIMLVGLTLLYVSNRYKCQQALIEGKHLSDTLLDRRYKALTAQSQLLEITLRSNVENKLADSTIHTPVEPVFEVQN